MWSIKRRCKLINEKKKEFFDKIHCGNICFSDAGLSCFSHFQSLLLFIVTFVVIQDYTYILLLYFVCCLWYVTSICYSSFLGWCFKLLLGNARYASYKISGYVRLLVLHLLLKHLAHRQNVASVSFFLYFGNILLDVYLNWFNWFHFLILKRGLLVILIDCMIFLSSFLHFF